jgi:hypothetical protein
MVTLGTPVLRRSLVSTQVHDPLSNPPVLHGKTELFTDLVQGHVLMHPKSDLGSHRCVKLWVLPFEARDSIILAG